tara:strand:+ start:1448 stop:2881 length:1434 start_codon:yes stop_codon:yes gene_type:complete
MCGLVGIYANHQVSQQLFEALLTLQHRGQDVAGMLTMECERTHMYSAEGSVVDVFSTERLSQLSGSCGLAYVTQQVSQHTGTYDSQSVYLNYPYGLGLFHDGHLTNSDEVRLYLSRHYRQIKSSSDTELLLNLFAQQLANLSPTLPMVERIFAVIHHIHQIVRGAYACVVTISGYGLVAFRDAFGIRPLILGRKQVDGVISEYMVASESSTLISCGFEVVRDIAPGEAIYIDQESQLMSQQCAVNPQDCPCIFEYVACARSDSIMDKISVYQARKNIGQALADKIKKKWDDYHIDQVISVPNTSLDIALQLAASLSLPYRQALLKHHTKSKHQALNDKSISVIEDAVKGCSVLLVGDSIIRGRNTSKIISMLRDAGVEKVYFASATPKIKFPNVYGIQMPCLNQLIAYGRETQEISQLIGADDAIFQNLSDLVEAVQQLNPSIARFETSLFNGHYVTDDIDQSYLDHLIESRSVEYA